MSLSSPLHDSSRTGPPTVLTKPLRFAGSKLQLNVHTGGGGSVIVEMQDIVSRQAPIRLGLGLVSAPSDPGLLASKDGKPLPGFTLAECIPMIVDSVNATVIWSPAGLCGPSDPHCRGATHSDVSALSGKPVRLKLQMVGAQLYSFRFS